MSLVIPLNLEVTGGWNADKETSDYLDKKREKRQETKLTIEIS